MALIFKSFVNFLSRQPRTSDAFDEPARPPKIHISCLVDNQSRFRLQAWNWLLSLRALDSDCRIFIHHLPGALSETVMSEFRSLGARLIETAAFGEDAARFSNKIRQLESPELVDADFVILSDADLVFLNDPAKLIEPGRFRAKPVDMPNPPMELLQELYRRAGFENRLEAIPLGMMPSAQTAATNFNGGLYVMPGDMARALAPLWAKHARFVLGQGNLLKGYTHHADQLGMGFALLELGVEIFPLPDGANLPTHLNSSQLSLIAPQDISALHYHGELDQHGLPKRVGLDWIDAAITKSRELLTEQRRKNFSNEIFWDFRYQHFPELGSGLGSRGEVLAMKQDLLRPYLTMMGERSLLDIGCGDLEFFEPFAVKDYTGLDISEGALSIARAKRPDWNFSTRRIDEVADSSFDYCSCIDVLIHQSDLPAAQALASDLVRVSRKGIFFSVHSKSDPKSGISFDSSSIKDFVAKMPEISGLYAIGSYRDVTLFFAEKNHGERLTRADCGLQEMAIGVRHGADPTRLSELVEFSRAKVGFFPTTVIRAHEYPWFVEQLQDCAGQRMLDVGAGVCCIPFYLAERGAQVTTVDFHSSHRNTQPMAKWNEWGYLDYNKLDKRIRSFNADMSTFEDKDLFDTIYSISVIEHMPASVRRAVIDRISALLKPGGRVVLSLDIIPGTSDLWNYSEGKLVDPENHGNYSDIKAELTAAGLPIKIEDHLCGMPTSRTDVFYLICQKSE